jgi:excisionase family DNA binding protein
MEYLSTQQVAERLGIDSSGVRKLILSGRLPAMKVGRDHLIKAEDLALVSDRKPGRPKKVDEAETRPAPPPHPPFPTSRPKKANGAKKSRKKRATKKSDK